jgi:hypothetical protein
VAMPKKGKTSLKEKPESQLAHFFHRNGCMRVPNETRYLKEGSQKYKKGYEIRLVAQTETELKQIGRLLKQAGFRAGKPYQKGNQMVLPIYGKQEVEKFQQLLSSTESLDLAD